MSIHDLEIRCDISTCMYNVDGCCTTRAHEIKPCSIDCPARMSVLDRDRLRRGVHMVIDDILAVHKRS